MGAVALSAAHRFDTTAAQLSSLAVMQLLFYASAQIPVGILLDRFGSKRILISGALLMALGQLTVAFANHLGIAVGGRILVGLGDACTFISMIRMANSWYSGSRSSHLQQWLATIGQTGQIFSAVPFALFLHLAGWESAFLGLVAVSVLVAALLFWLGNDNPIHAAGAKQTFGDVFKRLRGNIKKPVTWVAFFTHFSTQSSGTTFALLWGMPFMVSGLDLSPAQAGGFIVLFVVTNSSAGPLIGWFCAKFPAWRPQFVYIIVALVSSCWVIIALVPGKTPLALLTCIVMLIGLGGPSSMIAFDYSKEAIAPKELGATNGLINVGGFLASLVMMWLIGFSLDLQGGSNLYSLQNFKAAFLLELIVIGVGVAGLYVSLRAWRNKTHRQIVVR